MPKKTLILDSSQLAAFDECPQMWDYSYVQSISKVDAPPNDPMLMGTYGHRLLDIYYKAIAQGKDMNTALEEAKAFDPDQETCVCGKSKDKHTVKLSELEGLKQNWYCELTSEEKTFQAKPYPLDAAQRKLVQDRVTIHCYTYSQQDFKPKSPDHVEVGFSHKLFESDDRLYILEGRIDNIGSIGGQDAIMDHKFQMRRRDIYKKSIQARNYTLVADCPIFIFNYIRLTQKMDKDTLSRQVAQFSTLEREWWRVELIKRFDKVFEAQQCDTLEKRWGSCSGKFGYECQYTQLCEEIVPEVQRIKKAQLYHPKEVWRPW